MITKGGKGKHFGSFFFLVVGLYNFRWDGMDILFN